MRRRPPWLLVLLALLGGLLLGLPLLALSVDLDPSVLAGLASDPALLEPLRLSLLTATVAMLVSTLLGVPLAWVLSASEHPVVRLLRGLLALPLVLPPVVGGVALMLAFGRTGLVGAPLYRATGWALPFTTSGTVVAATFVAMPFLVMSLEGALRQRDVELEEAAVTMGASAWQVLRHVTLPLAAPSLGAGMVLCWARALGEFGATITFAGNMPGRTQTVPLAVYVAMEQEPDKAVALSVVMMLVSAVAIIALRGHWWPELRGRGEGL